MPKHLIKQTQQRPVRAVRAYLEFVERKPLAGHEAAEPSSLTEAQRRDGFEASDQWLLPLLLVLAATSFCLFLAHCVPACCVLGLLPLCIAVTSWYNACALHTHASHTRRRRALTTFLLQRRSRRGAAAEALRLLPSLMRSGGAVLLSCIPAKMHPVLCVARCCWCLLACSMGRLQERRTHFLIALRRGARTPCTIISPGICLLPACTL